MTIGGSSLQKATPMGRPLQPLPKPSFNFPAATGCQSCGCQSSGSCGAVIKMLQQAAVDARHSSDAARQGDAALVATLRRRCSEAEERLRRADWENAVLKSEADSEIR